MENPFFGVVSPTWTYVRKRRRFYAATVDHCGSYYESKPPEMPKHPGYGTFTAKPSDMTAYRNAYGAWSAQVRDLAHRVEFSDLAALSLPAHGLTFKSVDEVIEHAGGAPILSTHRYRNSAEDQTSELRTYRYGQGLIHFPQARPRKGASND
jgi:hypothetical protein